MGEARWWGPGARGFVLTSRGGPERPSPRLWPDRPGSLRGRRGRQCVLRSQQGLRAGAAPDSGGPGRAADPGDGLVQDETHGLRWPRLPHRSHRRSGVK